MRALPAPGIRLAPLRLTTRKVSRARVLLGRKPGLGIELDALLNAAASGISATLSAEIQLTARVADSPTLPSRALGHTAVLCAIALEGPGTEAFLEVDPRLVATLAALRTGGTGPDVPVLAASRFERTLLAELLLGILAVLRESGAPEARWRPRLVEVGTPRFEAERRLGAGPSLLVELAIAGAAVRGRAVLHLPELALRAVALGIPEHCSARALVVAQVRLPFSPRIQCGAAWAHTLAGLTGAAVVLPGSRLVGGCLHGPLSLVRPGVALRGTLGPDGLRHDTVELRPSSQEVTHVDPALSELPVELEVELARVPLSLAELGALQPGAVVPLRVNAGDPVFLRAGDRRIGRAELVEVEGEVAARVLELIP
jgi:flagellar motor switch/type III secretory pathway protein FliN